MEEIITVCYGKEEKWHDRRQAMEHFIEGMMCCEGAERERYTRIYTQLASGLTYCTDKEDI